MKNLAIQRGQDGRYSAAEATETYRQHGIVVLKRCLPHESQPALRKVLETKVESRENRSAVLKQADYPKADFLLGDVLAVREMEPWNHIFFAPDCLNIVRELLQTDELVYWGDSSIQFGEAARGFHKDNVDRNDRTRDDWSRDYDLVRCGFYFQDHKKHSGGLKIRLGSHNVANHRDGKMADVSTEYGDLVIWNMRLTHSGNNRKLRAASSFVLHPRFEEVLPAVLFAPEEKRRIATFCSFGKPGSHLDRYIARMNERDKDYRPYFQHARKPAEAAQLLSSRDVVFRRPNDYYGEFD